MSEIIKVGTFVKSHFRASWKGIVTSFEIQKGSGKKSSKLCTILILKDRNGNEMKKKDVKVLCNAWLEVIDEVEMTEKQINWIENNILKSKLKEKYCK